MIGLQGRESTGDGGGGGAGNESPLTDMGSDELEELGEMETNNEKENLIVRLIFARNLPPRSSGQESPIV